MPNSGKDHIFLNPEKFSDIKQYDYPGKPFPKQPVPSQNRTSHTVELREQVRIITKEMAAAIALQEESKSILDRGLIVEFESYEGPLRDASCNFFRPVVKLCVVEHYSAR